ncbi:GNAT family N-acetyltransferase [Pseudoalteromonas nigrifaciens]|uniref:GNAT family N-acetyltransferase n=1 Tax=Pseudoalteromonas nigrifaciens TaxID=28109 RepID=UPI003FD07869
MNDFRVELMCLKQAASRVKFLREKKTIKNIFMEQPVSLEGTIEWCKKIINDRSRKDFVFLRDDTVLGFSGLVNISRADGRAEFYIFISADEQGKGYGTAITKWLMAYAQVEMNLRKVSLYVTAGNESAIALYEKVGFINEGTLKKHSWFRGLYVDRLIFSKFLNDEIEFDNLYKHIY